MTGRRAAFWLLAGTTLAVYLTMLFWSLPRLDMGEAGRAFDLRPFGYGPDETRAYLGALGEAGRAFYRDVQQGLDLLFPALLALTLAIAFRALAPAKVARWLAALALLAAACDYLENHAVRAMLALPPEAVSDAMVIWARGWTMTKSALGALALTAALVLAVSRLRGRVRVQP
ncbi:hypothetical protein OU426_15455 [Frigidibacter sp. RF13]|uniref:hypothetical protein n=1 Tax=Frigidibacter sp. RF13 TaxID=2997340 RepID=UPI0022711716|nr:hypothetical protein [Frigidibacter sp. RF13]MCY1128260.1 hypothetical protein [Frigidibacter sp. RF13]